MAVSIEEITANVQAPANPPASAPRDSGNDQPETQLRRQCDMLVRVERRAARLRAD
jgi:hypothetical protein